MSTLRNAFLTYLMPILTAFLLLILMGIAAWRFTQLGSITNEMIADKQEELN